MRKAGKQRVGSSDGVLSCSSGPLLAVPTCLSSRRPRVQCDGWTLCLFLAATVQDSADYGRPRNHKRSRRFSGSWAAIAFRKRSSTHRRRGPWRRQSRAPRLTRTQNQDISVSLQVPGAIFKPVLEPKKREKSSGPRIRPQVKGTRGNHCKMLTEVHLPALPDSKMEVPRLRSVPDVPFPLALWELAFQQCGR